VLLAVPYDLRTDFALLAVFAAFEYAHHHSLVFAAGTGDLSSTNVLACSAISRR
jgi:hypothetical protein